jgi:hypothetical protein
MQERQATPEPFVSAEVAAEFLGIKRRLLLSMARMGISGSYAIGTGDFRKTWIFKLSELSAAIAPKRYDPIRRFPLK